MSYSYEETLSTNQGSANFVGYSNASNAASSYLTYSTGSSYGASGNANTGNTANQIATDLLRLSNVGSANIVSSGAQSGNFNVETTVLSAGANASISAGSQVGFLSDIEQAILRSQVPLNINETEEITVLGQRGIWANKQEVINWRGVIPITEYLINEDQNPEIITKRTQQQLEYIQELAIRYLRPPTPPAPGEIIITQEQNTLIPPAPPLIIRQQPVRPSTPEPLIIREAPPQPPAQVGRKVITISGKRLPPPPRKVVIERLAPLPSKPQSVIVERWLPYSQVKRRVIYQKSNERDPVIVKPRNVIIQWEAPQVQIKKDFKYLGVIRANPVEYVQRYGTTLRASRDLPDFVLDIKTPQGLVLAADYQYNNVHELEGELQALRLVDLDREGLGQYRAQLERLGLYQSSQISFSSQQVQQQSSINSYLVESSSSRNSNVLAIVSDIFAQVDRDNSGKISLEEAEKLMLKLNSRLERSYGEDDVRRFFQLLDTNNDGQISLDEFKRAFENLLK